MRKFVIYRVQAGNPNGDTGTADLDYHWAMWVAVPPALHAHHANPAFVSAVPPASPERPWGIAEEELVGLRAGEYVERLYDGQFPPDHPPDGIAAHILSHHASRQAEMDRAAPAHTDHLGLGG